MPKTMVNKEGFEYNQVMKRFPNECDSCSYGMTKTEFEKAVECKCRFCLPWVICEKCHSWRNEASTERR